MQCEMDVNLRGAQKLATSILLKLHHLKCKGIYRIRIRCFLYSMTTYFLYTGTLIFKEHVVNAQSLQS